MQMNVRERLQDDRPYWKVLVSLVFSLVGTLLFIYIGVKGLIYFMPFTIGWFLSFVARPLVLWLEDRFKIVKKFGSALIIVLVLALCVGAIYLLISGLWGEIKSLMVKFPSMYKDLEAGLQKIGERGAQVFVVLPEEVREGWNAMIANVDKVVGEVLGKVSEPTVEAAGNVAKRIPNLFVATIVTFISAYFFTAQKEEVLNWAKRVSPDPIVNRMTLVMDNLKYAVGGYFKAQFKIMVVVFAILFVGFSFVRVHFAILLALGIAALDFLPFFGTGTALWPWALYKVLVGDYKMAIALMVIYAITQVVRQLIQPKLVGDSMGMHPIVTLFLLYTGYKIGGIFAMILSVPIGLIVMNLYKAGAFDYILNDIWILTEGVMSLRETGKAEKDSKK